MKHLIIFTLSLIFLNGFSQEGIKVDYKYKDSNQNTNCSLIVIKNEAIFKFYDGRESGIQDNADGSVAFVTNDDLSKFYFVNERQVFNRHIFLSYEILSVDDYKDKVKWEINYKSRKKIGVYNCIEAKTFLNGRNYIAWFTLDVPIKIGPMKFQNLPGLVVEVLESNGYFTLILQKIAKVTKPKNFDFYKNYFLKTKTNVYSYNNYEKKVIETVIANRIRTIESVKKENLNGGRMKVDEGISNKSAVDMFVDIPSRLLTELKKYRF